MQLKRCIRGFLLLFILFSPIKNFAEGFLARTLVRTASGYAPIDKVAVGDFIYGYDKELNLIKVQVKSVVKKSITRYAKVYVNATCIAAAIEQKLYTYDRKWVCISDLKIGDLLINGNNQTSAVNHIEWIEDFIDVYLIEVSGYHTFCVTQFDFCAHNFVPIFAIGISWVIGGGVIEFSGLSIGLASLGLYFGCLFSKNKKASVPVNVNIVVESCVSGMPSPDPNKKDRDKARANHCPLTNKQARVKAEELGYKEGSNPPFNSHGKPVFKNGKRWISPDRDGHNGGIWKMFDAAGRRIGTWNANLTEMIGK